MLRIPSRHLSHTAFYRHVAANLRLVKTDAGLALSSSIRDRVGAVLLLQVVGAHVFAALCLGAAQRFFVVFLLYEITTSSITPVRQVLFPFHLEN